MTTAAETWSTLLTPSGVGAIGIIRVCGPRSLTAVSSLFQSAIKLGPDSLREGRLRYGRLVDGDEFLDDVLVSAVAGSIVPTFDITAHGGVRVLERILSALESRGVPFRTTTRDVVAFSTANQIEREVLSELQHARTARAAIFLARQRTNLPGALDKIRLSLSDDPSGARAALADLHKRAPAALHLIHGITVVLTGPPNSGKSTLFNRLVGRPAALVSPRPGTTRDWITADIDMLGLPVRLIDTAGIRSAAEVLERTAIDRGQDAAESATIRLLVLDATQPPLPEPDFNAITASQPAAILFNKMDVCTDTAPAHFTLPDALRSVPILNVSAATGAGLSALSNLILQRVGLEDNWDSAHPAFFTARQIHLTTAWLQSEPEQFVAAAAAFHHRLLHEPPAGT